MRFLQALNTKGGHILVALFIFIVGVVLVVWGNKEAGGAAIISGATSSIYTMLNSAGKNKDDGTRTD